MKDTKYQIEIEDVSLIVPRVVGWFVSQTSNPSIGRMIPRFYYY